VSPVRYELGFYIPEDGILHSYHCENLKSYIKATESVLFILCSKALWVKGSGCICGFTMFEPAPEASSQLKVASDKSQGNCPPGHIGMEAGWPPEPVWTILKRRKIFT
jgi:hypothetical protein